MIFFLFHYEFSLSLSRRSYCQGTHGTVTQAASHSSRGMGSLCYYGAQISLWILTPLGNLSMLGSKKILSLFFLIPNSTKMTHQFPWLKNHVYSKASKYSTHPTSLECRIHTLNCLLNISFHLSVFQTSQTSCL